MARFKSFLTILASCLVFFAAAVQVFAQDIDGGYAREKAPPVSSNSSKHPHHRKTGHHHHRHHAKKHRSARKTSARARVPDGVATSLPEKHEITHTSTVQTDEDNKVFGVATTLPVESPSAFSAAVQFTSASIENGNNLGGLNSLNALILKPRVLYHVDDELTVYGALPLISYLQQSSGHLNAIGRPELGSLKTVTMDDDFSWGAGINLRLPLYTLYPGPSGATPYIEPLRVWEIEPGLTANYRVPDSNTHLTATFNLAYDTQAAFATSATNPTTGLSQITDGLRYPLAAKGNLSVSHDTENLSLGMAFHTVNWLASGELLSEGSVFETVSPLDLARGEIYALYRFARNTKADLSISHGFKTSFDPNTYAEFDDPIQVSNFAVSLGLSQMF